MVCSIVLDVVIRNGIIVDGSGSPPFRGDVGVKGDSIVSIGDLSRVRAERVIDTSNLVVSPGFIDLHNHSDLEILAVPTADNYIMQGVTTLVTGNCGYSPAPISELNKDLYLARRRKTIETIGGIRWGSFEEYLDVLDKSPKATNIAPLIGHGAVRSSVMGAENREPTDRELGEMREIVEKAMKAGAFGISTGLIYIPGVFAKKHEIVELAKVSARYGGIYASHMRDEGNGLIDSIIETIYVGLESGAGVEISHLKAAGRPAWGNVSRALRVIEDYVRRGYDVSADAYPYTASSTGLEAIFPSWSREGGVYRLIDRLKDRETFNRIVKHFERSGIMDERYLDWGQIYIASSESHREFEGLSILEIAEQTKSDPVDVASKILIDDQGSTTIIIHSMSEEDVREAISHPLVAISSDGSVRKPGEGKPHPRNYGTYPRVLGHYVRDLKLITLEEAIRKMTSLPARKLGLWDRGLIRPGFKADITIFNPYTVNDRSTFQDPHKYPQGIEYVLVNGEVVVDEGEHTGKTPGRLLRKTRIKTL